MTVSVTMMSIGLVLNSVSEVITDLSGHLDLDGMALLSWHRDTDLSGHLVGALDRLLVALSVLLGVALGSAGVSVAGLSLSLSLPLAVAGVSDGMADGVSDDLGVVSDDSRAVVHLGGGGVTVGGESLLAFLDVGGVDDGLADGSGHLAGVLDWLLVTLSVLLVVALGFRGVAGLGFSLSLSVAVAVADDSVGNDLGVVTDNGGAVVNLLGSLFTVGGDDVLALFDVGGVDDDVVLLVALLTLVVDRLLVALLVGLAEALLVVVLGVSVAGLGLSLGLSLVVARMAVGDNGGVVADNGGRVVHLLVDLFTVLGHDVLALLDVSGVDDDVVFLVALLFVVGLTGGVVLDVVGCVTLALVVVVTAVVGVAGSGGGEASQEDAAEDGLEHDDDQDDT